MTNARVPRLETVRCMVRDRLRHAARSLGVPDAPFPTFEGGLLRPLVAVGFAPDRAARDDAFWNAALAIELAHEASLVHDDIIDDAPLRRGQPSAVGGHGVAVALALGDHYLTLAYRAAAATRSLPFIDRFTQSVERTVAGERAQGKTAGRTIGFTRYRDIVLGKSGELLGCAAAASSSVHERATEGTHYELGRQVGLIYQMLDDLLDYCPATSSGKRPLADYGQSRWTWVLEYLPDADFGLTTEQVHHALFHGGTWAPAHGALLRFEAEVDAVSQSLRRLGGRSSMLHLLLGQWQQCARDAVAAEIARLAPAPEPALTPPPPQRWSSYFATNSRSFRFAAWALPGGERDRIARVYAFCRYTDDLVDTPTETTAAMLTRLDGWLACARAAYHGGVTRIPLLDATMRDMATGGAPFDHVEQLVEGMRMDVRGVRYKTLAQLRQYTYRVASTVGLWLTEMYGVHDQWMLERAAALGHAMQLTNIIRDVGEDLDRGRIYLPDEMLDAHGVSRSGLAVMRGGAPLTGSYRQLIAEMIDVARAEYAIASPAMARLPKSLGRAVAVASAVYAAILDDVEQHDYDNLRRRAHTSLARKVVVGSSAMLAWRASRHRDHPRQLQLANG